MTQDSRLEPQVLSRIYFGQKIRQKRKATLKAFWITVALLAAIGLPKLALQPFETSISVILIVLMALLPTYLWCSGKVFGFPIFPASMLIYIITYALPILNQDERIVQYSVQSYLNVSLVVVLFLLVGTLTWFQFVKSPGSAPRSYRVLSSQGGGRYIWFFLILSTGFNMVMLGGWIHLSGGIYPIVRAVCQAIGTISIFVIGYRWGRRELSKKQTYLFFLLFYLFLMSSAASLILIGAFAACILTTLAFIIARKKFPLVFFTIMFGCLLLLHYGKGEMRKQYWFEGAPRVSLQPWDYPKWYAEWLGYSLEYIGQFSKDSNRYVKSDRRESFLERSSLVHIMLIVQEKSPKEVPYLKGGSYMFIPQAIIPRFLYKNKPWTHEGLFYLNTRYGLQSQEETYKTTIGWGLLNEAYANFGYWGCLLLGLALGSLYGYATRLAIYAPIDSARSFFCMILLGFMVNGDSAASVYISSLFQALVPLGFFSLFLMKNKLYKPSDTVIF